MIWLYRILFFPALLLCLPYYLLRMFRRGGYRAGFAQRFGLLPPIVKGETTHIWIQAVSVGEVNALKPLLEKLHAEGKCRIILTTTTSTGYALARERYAGLCTFIGIFPLDFWPFSALAWRCICPDIIVLMESELWPEHCHRARKRSVPILLVNARMSDRSFRRYCRLRPIARWLFRMPRLILASNESDAERFRKLGVEADRISCCGNMKFDLELPKENPQSKAALFDSLGFSVEEGQPAPLILLGSSTWPGEEALLLETHRQARAMGLDVRLLLVPRHAERRNEIAAMLAKQPLRWHQRSTGSLPSESVDIHLADTTGELSSLTLLADVIFVGKSLPPNEGGQTPIEAAAAGKAVIYGPRMSNFRALCQSLEAKHAALRAQDASEAQAMLLTCLRDAGQRARLGEAARQWHASHRGATNNVYSAIRTHC